MTHAKHSVKRASRRYYSQLYRVHFFFFYKEMYKLRPAFKMEILAAEGEGPISVLAGSGCFLYLLCAAVPSSGWC